MPGLRLVRWFSTALLLAALFAVGSAAEAQSGIERIRDYDVSISITSSGDIVVRETIVYDFGANARRGIFRTIPVRVRYDDDYDRRYPIDSVLVSTGPDTPGDVRLSQSSGILEIRVGDPDVYITGVHTYEIAYTVEGALNSFDTHDELYWNAIGTEWPVPIDEATVDVESALAPITQITCFRGPQGSSLPCAAASSEPPLASFSDAGLLPFEGLTVVVGIEPGVIEPPPVPILVERWSLARAFTVDPPQLAVAIGVFVVGLVLVGWLLWRHGRDRRFAGSVVAATLGSAEGIEERVPLGTPLDVPVEFVPPDGLRPGQVGTIVDETAHPLDVTATIVDLAVRGYIRIEETVAPKWYRKGDWRLVKLRDHKDPELLAYESKLLYGLFQGRGDEVELSDLRAKFAKRMKGVQDALYDDTVRRGWFLRRPDTIRRWWTAIAVLALTFAIGAAAVLVWLTTFGWVGVALALVALVLLISSKRMPRRTAKGRAVFRRVLGFRRFIEESERDRARFAEEQHLFTEYLPFAIVFGEVDRWAAAFEGLELDESDTAWYVGYAGGDHFNQQALGGALGDFSVATAGTLTSTPAGSGSSGFSGGGGGFSGGGGGGGGGGSW